MGRGEVNKLDQALAAEVEDWRRQGLGRSLGGEEIGGSGGVDFTSNDYLGMARHPAVCAAASEAARGPPALGLPPLRAAQGGNTCASGPAINLSAARRRR